MDASKEFFITLDKVINQIETMKELYKRTKQISKIIVDGNFKNDIWFHMFRALMLRAHEKFVELREKLEKKKKKK